VELFLCEPVLPDGVPAFGAGAGGVAGVDGDHFPSGAFSLGVQDRQEHPIAAVADSCAPLATSRVLRVTHPGSHSRIRSANRSRREPLTACWRDRLGVVNHLSRLLCRLRWTAPNIHAPES